MSSSSAYFGVGAGGLASLGSTTYNTGIGGLALSAVTTGTENVAVGYWAGASTTTGSFNLAFGTQALRLANGANSFNVAIGSGSQMATGAGSNYNLAMGKDSLRGITGSNNVGLGSNAGFGTTGSNNIFIGNDAGNGLGTISNSMIIGNWLKGDSNGYVGIGIASGTAMPTVRFDVQDGAGLPNFQVDTTNKQVRIGSSTTDTNAIQLVLDSYNTAADPTAAGNGSMYYNSNLGKFRCYENNTWKDCITAGPERVFLATTKTNSTTTQNDVTGLTLAVTSGRTYIFSCRLTHTTAATTTAGLFSVNGPASTNISYTVKTGYTATAEYQNSATTFNTAVNPGTGPGTTARQVYIDGTFTATASGTFAVRYASEVAGSAVNVLPNSFCTLQ